MEDTTKSAEIETQREHRRRPTWTRFVHYAIREARKRKSEKKPESAADKAARRTANATIAIAFLTLVIAIVSYFQWQEIHSGGKDTHDLAVAARDQAKGTQSLATNMQTQAERTRELAEQMKIQAGETKTIADQAVIQARAAKESADAAKKTFDLVTRPSVAIAVVYPPVYAENDGRVSGTVQAEFRNFGSATAINFTGRQQIIYNNAIDISILAKDYRPPAISIPPGQTTGVNVGIFDDQAARSAKISAGSIFICFEYSYDDENKKHYEDSAGATLVTNAFIPSAPAPSWGMTGPCKWNDYMSKRPK